MRPTLLLLLALVAALPAQAQQTSTLYEIAYKGTPVTVDAQLTDWNDAQWIFLSQDKVNFRNAAGNVIQGVPESPADFSGYFAMKMDDEAIYYAAIVRDEGTPMIDTPSTPNLAFNFDHVSLYLGLYDIGDRAGSPHEEANIEIYAPNNADTLQAERTYRVKPGSDNTTTTLGPDYQLLFRAVEYTADGSAVTGEAARAFTYNGALVDTTVAGLTGASRLFDNEKGYYLEWKVPFASLAGTISKKVGGAYALANLEWPTFEPADGKIIVFDADITDKDEGDQGLNRYLRIGDKPALFRDSKSFSMRGKIVDVSKEGNFAPSSRYFIDYKPTQNVTIDGSTDDWRDASFIGLSQDKYNFLTAGGSPIQGRPADPDDFSGHIAVKMDDTNLYFAARISDSGTPMIDTPSTPNLGFNFDHASLYLGLYDISNLPGSPHVEKNFNFTNADTVVTESAGSGYRIKPGTDDTESTIGPDYQIIIRALDYGGDGAVVTGATVSEYNGARVDSTITTTTVSTSLFDDEDGYVVEWMVPLASLSGDIASNRSRQAFAFYYDWPMFAPAVGKTIAFDADITDKDEGDQGLNRYLRVGNLPALFNTPANFSRRALITDGSFATSTAIEEVTSLPVMEGEGLLRASYPNPTSGDVSIPFEMPAAGMARLAVYNLLGQEVAVLVDGSLPQGGKVFHMDASRLPAGAYVYRLTTDRGVESRLMTVVR